MGLTFSTLLSTLLANTRDLGSGISMIVCFILSLRFWRNIGKKVTGELIDASGKVDIGLISIAPISACGGN